MADVEECIERAISKCLHDNGITLEGCNYWVFSCNDFRAEGPGVYVFFDDKNVYYVGESNDLKRRVLKEHCGAQIGGSEGVVRFLMYFLEEICEKRGEWSVHDVKDREEFVKEFLREKIGKMEIYVATCPELGDISRENHKKKNETREKLEECLIKELRPVLNPDEK